MILNRTQLRAIDFWCYLLEHTNGPYLAVEPADAPTEAELLSAIDQHAIHPEHHYQQAHDYATETI